MPAGEPSAIAGDCGFVVTWETALACPLRPHHAAAYAACVAAAVAAYVLVGFLCNSVRGRAAVPHAAHVRAAASIVAEHAAAAAGPHAHVHARARARARTHTHTHTQTCTHAHRHTPPS